MLGKFINHCEDSLTAAVFSHLLHLPTELFWQILSNACYSDKLPHHPGEPLHVDPWPNWDAAGTDNFNRVVPDLFMRFADFDLIVESKRWDDRMQNRTQWHRELVAYANEYGEERQRVVMIALGGIHGRTDDEISYSWQPSPADASTAEPAKPQRLTCAVHMCQWSRILEQCQRMRRQLAQLDYPSSQSLANGRILDHTIELFGWHGFSTGQWFSDFDFAENRLSPSVSSHLVFFTNRSKQLSHA